MWSMIAMAGLSAVQASAQYGAASAATKAGRQQAAWNDRNNRKSLAMTSTVIDTNVLRARTEATDQIQEISRNVAEASAYARVQAAATGIVQGSGGSYDTVLNSFARKGNEQTSNVLETLTANLVEAKLSRMQAALQATSQQSTTRYNSPSAAGYAIAGAENFFTSTYGLWGSSSGGGSQTPAPQPVSSMVSPFGLPGMSRMGGSQLFTQ